jgi:hypothetical protein
MTTSDIELLRLYVDDPHGENERFTSAQLQDFIDRFGDLHSAAAEVWLFKAATVAEWYMSQTDGALLDRGTVFKHCKDMADFHRSQGIESFDSISLITSDEQEEGDEF